MSHFLLLCWVLLCWPSHFHCCAECHYAGHHFLSLCWVSLYWMPLCWVLLCWASDFYCCAECSYAGHHFFIVMLSVIMLNAIMLSVIMLTTTFSLLCWMSLCWASLFYRYAECHFAECHGALVTCVAVIRKLLPRKLTYQLRFGKMPSWQNELAPSVLLTIVRSQKETLRFISPPPFMFFPGLISEKELNIYVSTRGQCYKTIAVIFHGKLPQ